MAKLQCVLFMGVVAAFISTVSSAALSEEDKNAVKTAIIPILAECGTEHKITLEDLEAAKKAQDFDGVNPCFYACFLKKLNIIDESGNYDPEAAKAEHAKYVHDEETLAKLNAVSDSCVSVNEKPVTDDCGRAEHLVSCMKEHKDVFLAIFKD